MYQFDVCGTALSPHKNDVSFSMLSEHSQRSERYGHSGLLAFYNHRVLDPWAVAAVILQQTEKVVPLVALQPYAMPPLTAAKMVHSLSSLYGRRIDINLITGVNKAEIAQIGARRDHDDRYAQAAEYMSIVSRLLRSDEPLDHEGAFYRFQGLTAHSRLDPELRPRVFVAGSSDASWETAKAVADISVTHAEPVGLFEDQIAARERQGLDLGVRFGILARSSSDEAWEIAHSMDDGGRASRLQNLLKTKSDSAWSRKLAVVAAQGDVHDGVYWTGAYRNNKGAAPYLVGTYDSVAEYLERYFKLGVNTLLLGSVFTEDEFRHVDAVLSRLR